MTFSGLLGLPLGGESLGDLVGNQVSDKTSVAFNECKLVGQTDSLNTCSRSAPSVNRASNAAAASDFVEIPPLFRLCHNLEIAIAHRFPEKGVILLTLVSIGNRERCYGSIERIALSQVSADQRGIS